MPVRILVGQPTRSDGRTTPIHGQPWGLVDLIRWTQITNTFIRCLERFRFYLNLGGFPKFGISDSRWMLDKEASIHATTLFG